MPFNSQQENCRLLKPCFLLWLPFTSFSLHKGISRFILTFFTPFFPMSSSFPVRVASFTPPPIQQDALPVVGWASPWGHKQHFALALWVLQLQHTESTLTLLCSVFPFLWSKARPANAIFIHQNTAPGYLGPGTWLPRGPSWPHKAASEIFQEVYYFLQRWISQQGPHVKRLMFKTGGKCKCSSRLAGWGHWDSYWRTPIRSSLFSSFPLLPWVNQYLMLFEEGAVCVRRYFSHTERHLS